MIEKSDLNSQSFPLVSVLITCYNQEAFIESAIQSVLIQEYPNIQIVVTDDGSTDSSPPKIQKLKDNFTNKLSIYLNDDNVGITGNHNRGLRHCDGEIVFLLDGDDIFLPGKIQIQVEFMLQHPNCVVSFHDTEVFDSKSGHTIFLWSEKFFPYVSGVTSLIRYGNYLCSPSIAFRYNRKHTVIYDERISSGSDWLFIIDLLSTKEKGELHYIDSVLSRYRRHLGNFTLNWEEKIQDQIKTLSLIESKYPVMKRFANFRQSDIYFMLAIRSTRKLFFRKAIHEIWKAFILSGPSIWRFSRLPIREIKFILTKSRDPLFISLFRK